MTRVALLSMGILLISHAMADIMLQPGYQQQKGSKQESFLQPIQQPVGQTSEHLARSAMGNAFDTGYHIELHPVYSDQYHIPADAVESMMHAYLRPSNMDYRHMALGNGGSGVMEMPMSSYHQYVPMPAQNRRRRSTGSDEPSVSTQRTKRDKDDVATKSSLDDSTLSVVDLPNKKKDKRLKVRQSNLLGLNPSSMYSAQPQYHVMQMDPAQNSHQQMASQQAMSEMNSRSSGQESILVQGQSGSPLQFAVPQVNLGNMQHAMLLQQPGPQQQMVGLPQFKTLPEHAATLNSGQTEHPIAQRESQNPTQANNDIGTDVDSEMVGTKHRKTKVVHHVHHHTKIMTPGTDATTITIDGDGPQSTPMVEVDEALPQSMPMYQPSPMQSYEQPPVQTYQPSPVQMYQPPPVPMYQPPPVPMYQPPPVPMYQPPPVPLYQPSQVPTCQQPACQAYQTVPIIPEVHYNYISVPQYVFTPRSVTESCATNYVTNYACGYTSPNSPVSVCVQTIEAVTPSMCLV